MAPKIKTMSFIIYAAVVLVTIDAHGFGSEASPYYRYTPEDKSDPKRESVYVSKDFGVMRKVPDGLEPTTQPPNTVYESGMKHCEQNAEKRFGNFYPRNKYNYVSSLEDILKTKQGLSMLSAKNDENNLPMFRNCVCY